MDNKIGIYKSSNELKKHVGTIHSSNPLSLVQRKISNALLYNAYHELLEQEEHIIDIKKLCKLIGYDSHDHKLIKTALKKLLSTVIEWNLLKSTEDEEDTWSASSMLASVSIHGSRCTYSYSSHLKKLLYMPSMYGRVNMSIQSKFKSSYALALYENCVRYQNLQYSGWFTIEIFRKLMGVNADKYKVFRDFKRRIIDKAIEEVNLYSNLTISPEMRRRERKVVLIRFKIDKKQKNTCALQSDRNLIFVLTREWNFSTENATKTLQDFKEEYILDKINQVVASSSFKKGRIKSKSAYLLKVLNENHKNSNCKSPAYKDYKNVAVNDNNQIKHCELIINIMKHECYHEIISDFELYLEKEHTEVLWKYYTKDGLNHNVIRSEFIQHVQHRYPDIFVELQ
jgi:plasmid replication initiation protein